MFHILQKDLTFVRVALLSLQFHTFSCQSKVFQRFQSFRSELTLDCSYNKWRCERLCEFINLLVSESVEIYTLLNLKLTFLNS